MLSIMVFGDSDVSYVNKIMTEYRISEPILSIALADNGTELSITAKDTYERLKIPLGKTRRFYIKKIE